MSEGQTRRKIHERAKTLLTIEWGTGELPEGVDAECAVGDLIADLMHFCDIEELDFYRALERAKDHYRDESRFDMDEVVT